MNYCYYCHIIINNSKQNDQAHGITSCKYIQTRSNPYFSANIIDVYTDKQANMQFIFIYKRKVPLYLITKVLIIPCYFIIKHVYQITDFCLSLFSSFSLESVHLKT